MKMKNSDSDMSSANLSQLNDLRSYSRHWLGEFIDLYQAEQCLWQPKHPDYSNHGVRNKAYDKLVEKLKEVEPSPDRAMVVRKINSLRSAFRREFRKSCSKPNYETRLWYYDKLLFIADQKPKRYTANGSPIEAKRSLTLGFDDGDSMDFEEDAVEHQTDGNQSGEVVTPELMVKNENSHHIHLQQHDQHGNNSSNQQHSQSATVKVLEITSLDTNAQREIQQAVNSLEQHQMHQQQLQHQQSAQLAQIHQQVPTIQIAREHIQPLFTGSSFTTSPQRHNDEYDAVGINVASKLRSMNATQRIIAEKLISDVLFNGQLDNLNVNTTLSH